MKNNSILTMAATMAAAMLIASCSTTSKMNIYGVPGSQIYTTMGEQLGTIPADGKLNIKLPDNGYYAMLLAASPGDSTVVPFALDYDYTTRTGTRIANAAGTTLAVAGAVGILAGAVESDINNNYDAGATTAAAGTVALGAGVAVAAPTGKRIEQTAYNYNFKYLEEQGTNNDMHFTRPVITPATDSIGLVSADRP